MGQMLVILSRNPATVRVVVRVRVKSFFFLQ